ncbi:MAG: hypothetical protein GKC10_03225 [Methanosarcinales archaeon]|nr:hypothetical protein [Methanosarcinales archaeon]
MKRIAFLPILLILAILADPAAGSAFMRVIEAPTVHVSACGEANFTITVQNQGGDGEYARLIYRGLTQGLWIKDEGSAKYVYQGGKVKFNLTLAAGNIVPGNYNFDIGFAAKGSPANYRRIDVVVERPTLDDVPAPAAAEASAATEQEGAEATAEVTQAQPEAEVPAEEQAEGQAQPEEKSPGPGAALAVLALVLASRRLAL